MPKDFSENPAFSSPPAPRRRVLPVYAITPFTMIDFPDRTACVVWFSGCTMRCPYCHNPDIVKGKGRGTAEDVLAFLRRRRGLLDGVVLSGGEASVYPGLPDLIATIKGMGFAVKLDTNGLRPDIIEDFLSKGFLDYVALDYKAPPEKFQTVTGTDKYDAFSRTLDLLCAQDSVPFEVRTTVHTALLDVSDVAFIIGDLVRRAYKGTYYVQNYRADNGRETLGKLPPQEAALDISALPHPAALAIEFRNF